MKKLLLIIIALPYIFSSCYTIRPIGEIMDTWLGATEHDVILHFGSPAKSSDDGAGGKILLYSHSQSTTLYSPYSKYGNSSTTYNTSKYMEFYINKEGKVYTWRTNLPDEKISDPRNSNATAIVVILLITGLAYAIYLAGSK